MISFYESNETDFKHNGGVINNALSCKVIEEANGLYELELICPISDIALELTDGKIVKAPTPRGDQLFRIYKPVKTLNAYKVYARHIFYDLLDNFIEDVRPTSINGQGAISDILNATTDPHNFTGYSDIENMNTAYTIRKNPVQALIGTEDNSFLNRWGGELLRDNFGIKILQNAGIDRGYEARLGKNIFGVEEELDTSGITTKLYPTVVLEDNQVYTLPEKYIESTLIGSYPHPITREVRIELTEEEKALPLVEIFEIMRSYCLDFYNVNNIDKPRANYKIDFIELSKTEHYKDLAILEQIDLYDTVTAVVDTLNINIKAKVIRTVYDGLKKRYEQIELGNFTNRLSNQKQQVTDMINKATEGISETTIGKKIRDYTDKITGNLGGYVITRVNADGEPYEILLMDTNDINTSKEVIRLNQEGIGLSTSGYNGPFDVAMTAKGIVASLITSGVIDANLIRAGVIEGGKVRFNLDNGTLLMGDSIEDYTFYFDGTNLWMDGKISFTDGGVPVAWIDGQKLYISTAEITDELIVGVHKLYKYNDDITIGMWIGGGA